MADRKKLLLLRHGKASGQPQFKDSERPLTTIGETQSRCISDWLKQAALYPDCWLVSSAKRTLQTAEIIRSGLGQQESVQNVSDSLYLASAEHLLTTLQSIPDTAQCTILVGHNPGLSELLLRLAGGQIKQFKLASDVMGPATLAVLEFEGSWDGLVQQSVSLNNVLHGKLLANAP